MLGMFFAGLCTFGLFRMWGRRRFGRYAYAGGGGRGCGEGRGFRHEGPGPRGWQDWRGLSELHLSGDQESAIRQSIREMADGWRKAQSPWGIAEAVAAGLTAESFHREAFMAGGKDDSFRSAAANAIERLRLTLEPEQRAKLAELLRQRFT